MTDRVGLANLGNTCFLNVVLQSLRASPALCDIFLKDEPVFIRSESKHKEMVSAFQTLMRDFWSVNAPEGSHPSLVPRGFLHSMMRVLHETDDDWYRPGRQCDAAEALQYILNSLHDGMYRRVKMEISGTATTEEEESHIKSIKSWGEFFSREYSPIIENFNGQHQIKITCSECKSVSERYEPWLMVKASIPGSDAPGSPAPTMEACLDKTFEPEILEDYNCDVCKGRKVAKIQTKISKLPPVTIMSLKRFTNAGHKVRGLIPWDLDEMDFSKWMAFGRDPFTDKRTPPLFETFAVIEHHGSTHGGHYRMYMREGDHWLEYDDSSVRVVSPDLVITQDSYIALMIPKEHAKTMNADMKQKIKELRKSKGIEA